MDKAETLTPKAQRTRQHIFDMAIRLFNEQGYDATTMRDIAAAADCSPGLTYRYFAAKDDLVIALYQNLAAETEAQIMALEGGTIAERFYQIMTAKFVQVRPYRDTMSALFSGMMNPKSGIGVLGTNTADIRDKMIGIFAQVVAGAKDAPKEPQVRQLAVVLYSAHMLLLLFWFYDRSPKQSATGDLLKFTREMMTLARPFLVLPPMAKSLTRVAGIVESVFGGQA